MIGYIVGIGLTADDFQPGTRFRVRCNGVVCVVVRKREIVEDIFGRPLNGWWCRREDTRQEGYIMLGSEGILDAELLS